MLQIIHFPIGNNGQLELLTMFNHKLIVIGWQTCCELTG